MELLGHSTPPSAAAKRPHRPRRWLLLILAVSACIPLGTELWRQFDIWQAQREWEESAAELAAPYAEVVSARDWCRERNPGKDGSNALRALIDAEDPLSWRGEELSLEDEEAVDAFLGRVPNKRLPRPDPALVTRLINRDEALSLKMRELLSYDHLLAVPMDEPEGVVSLVGVATLLARVVDRARLLAYVGRTDEALEEAVVACELSARLFPAAYLLGGLVAHAANQTVHERVGHVVAMGRLTQTQLDRLSAASSASTDSAEYMFETENLFFARTISSGMDPQELDDLRGDNAGWFSWYFEKEGDNVAARSHMDRFREAAANLRAEARTFQRRAALSSRVRRGEPVKLREIETLELFTAFEGRTAETDLWRKRTLALAEVRKQEAARTPWGKIALTADKFPDIQCRHEGAFIVLEFGPTPAVRNAFGRDDDESAGDDFKAAPLKIAPLQD